MLSFTEKEKNDSIKLSFYSEMKELKLKPDCWAPYPEFIVLNNLFPQVLNSNQSLYKDYVLS